VPVEDLFVSLIESGHIVDVMAGFVLIEVTALLWWRRRTGHGIPSVSLLANIGAGVCLMFALRCALTGASAWLLAAWLIGSLVCHVADLRLRWQGRAPAG